MKRRILLILLVVLLSVVILFGGVTVLVVADLVKGPNIQVEEISEEPTELYIYKLDSSITTNIKNSKKFVKCGLVFQLQDAEELPLMEKNDSRVRNIINETLRSYGETDYRQDDILDQISFGVISRVEQQIGIQSITDVYFEEFITH